VTTLTLALACVWSLEEYPFGYPRFERVGGWSLELHEDSRGGTFDAGNDLDSRVRFVMAKAEALPIGNIDGDGGRAGDFRCHRRVWRNRKCWKVKSRVLFGLWSSALNISFLWPSASAAGMARRGTPALTDRGRLLTADQGAH